MKSRTGELSLQHFYLLFSRGLIRAVAGTAGIIFACFQLQAAELKLPAIFGDHMVLQCGTAAPFWGTAGENEEVTVTAGTVSGKAKAGADGKWSLKLNGLKASEKPLEVTVSGASGKVTFKDVLIGDIWVCGGQSNMALRLGETIDGKAVLPAAKYPTLRFFNVATATSLKPLEDCKGKWELCTPETAARFSAVGFFFAKNILETQKLPLGMIGSNQGATPAQAWTSMEALSSDPELKNGFVELDKVMANLDTVRAEHEKWMKECGTEYKESLKKWFADSWAAQQKKTPVSPRPKQPAKPEPLDPDGSTSFPTVLFNGMIHPLIPFGIKGVVWYQGESNAGKPGLYRKLFPLMIKDWRSHWGQGDFPFLFVQLPNYGKRQAEPQEQDGWSFVRESQLLGLKSATNTGMAVTVDIGYGDNLHPPTKAGVGYRLALAARHIAYGEELVFSGPLYDSHKITGNKITVKFSNTGTGLKLAKAPYPSGNKDTPVDELKGFAVCGADNKLVWAKAVIEGADSVTVWSEKVAEPKKVYYGWGADPEVNLYNSADLPASPFRTDTTLPK